jgi:hypothetical protein
MPDNLVFPLVQKVFVKTIAMDLVPVQPLSKPTGAFMPIGSYTDYWGETVVLYKDGYKQIHSSGERRSRYGDTGHAFINGYFIVDEDGSSVYEGDPRFDQIFEKTSDYRRVLKELRDEFQQPDYNVERGRGQRLVINDKIVKGISIHPEMKIESNTLDNFIEIIREDIRIGRIRAGFFGTWKTEISVNDLLKENENTKA